MNQTQLKYARARAEAVFKKRTAEITKKHTTPARRLSDAEKLDALRDGRFTVGDLKAVKNGWWHNAIDFGETFETVDTAARDPEQAALAEAYRKLEDELVLGDNEQALALLKAFEAGDH